VLRRDGLALHLLPNPVWRLLSLVTYYPAQALDAVRWLGRKRTAFPTVSGLASGRPRPRALSQAVNRIIPRAHGSRGTALGELRRFSKLSWDAYFDRTGWDVVEYADNGLLASGDYLLGRALPMRGRAILGQAIGGIAHVYLVKPRPLA
jgi:hypothetical protein